VATAAPMPLLAPVTTTVFAMRYFPVVRR